MIVLQDFDNVQLSVYSSLESKQLIIDDGDLSLTYRFDDEDIDTLIDMLYNLKHSNNE
jgi:hypothetical protein